MKFEFSYWKYLMSPTGNVLIRCKNSIHNNYFYLAYVLLTMRANQTTLHWKTARSRPEKLGSNTKQMKTKDILCSVGQSLKKSTMKYTVSTLNHVTRSLLRYQRISKMNKKHNGTVRHAYLPPLLQIPIFQNCLIINVSCVRK